MEFGSREPHNLGPAVVRSHIWAGIEVHGIQQKVRPGRAWHLLHSGCPILSIVVNERGGLCEARPAIRERIGPSSDRRIELGHSSLIPADLPVWGYSEDIAQVDEVRLMLDADRVVDLLGGASWVPRLTEPNLMFQDEKLQTLGRLFILCQDDMAGLPLLGDSIVTAMIARCSRIGETNRQLLRPSGLSRHQMTLITDYVLDNLAKPIRLAELAAIAQLSPSQFGRAFKTSTGTTPHRWQLDARIEFAKRKLAERGQSLAEIALESGFSEQSHFTRAFRAVTGTTPNAWRHSQLG